ncbi:MHYT domain-containing protein [Psychrosphaera haliotis]|uniref:MHYT domain-containing protein n=1 Tax=Psychrosphaera haliotis TaxID=555083 RepID=UPI0031D4321E
MLNWLTTLFSIPPDNMLMFGTYSNWMVVLSIFIAIFASFMGLQVSAEAARAVSFKRKQIMLLIGSIALGGGIWSMHFIGMLAFNLCTDVEYGWQLTLLSLLPGIGASWVALNHIYSNKNGPVSLLIGGVLVGAGIGTMHYTGMAAMEMASQLRYDLSTFALSIVVAVSLAVLSLWIRFGLSKIWHKKGGEWQANLAASAVMGLAISGMHYTGMAAARFVKPPGFEESSQPPETSIYLALAVSGITILIICLVMGINIVYKYRDISQRALENERRLKATMDTAVDGIITIDKRGTVTSINKATEHLLGWSEAELVGNNVKMLVPEPFRSGHDGYIQRYLETGEARIIGQGREVQARHKDGETVDIRLGIGHVKLANNDFFVAFISDIRQRLKMENALRENEEKFRSLISNIPGIAYRCLDDENWSMVFISDAVQAITGYAANDFTLPNPTVNYSDLIHPDDLAGVNEIGINKGSFSIEYRIIRKDGTVRWVMEHGAYITEKQTGEVWLDGFIMDITERYQMVQELRQAKDKAEQAASARATFLANMSHEIRTPMNAIIGFSDILLDSEMENEQQRHLKTINNSAKSLLFLLNEVLDSAKLDKGKLDLEIRTFSLVEEVDAVISTLWLQARNKELSLITEVSPELESLYSGSPERIRQVLTNIVNNAIKFTQAGEVKLTVAPINGNHIEFVVKDTGIGMSPEQLSTVFEPFTQADASMSRRFGGTGLGTTISKQLVELMGGKISANSELNKGSEFRFVIPLSASQEVKEEEKQHITLPPQTILVVDDIQQNIDLLSVLLTRNGHKVLTARDGQQALIRMESEANIDLVLMDVQMPVMDGLTASIERRKIEQQHNIKPIPIVALTASVLEDDRLAAEAAGMEGFANKPIDFLLLNQEMARVLKIDVSNTQTKSSSTQSCALIDEKKGFSLWGSKTEYYQQLMYFVKEQRVEFNELQKSVDSSDWATLSASAHKLKGICGNLSLISLMRNFEKLEVVLTKTPEECRSTVDSIISLFHQVEIKVAETIEEKKAEATKDIDVLSLTKLLDQIEASVAENEIDESLLETLSEFKSSQYRENVSAITDAINDFEFEQAQLHIQTLLSKLHSQQKEL